MYMFSNKQYLFNTCLQVRIQYKYIEKIVHDSQEVLILSLQQCFVLPTSNDLSTGTA